MLENLETGARVMRVPKGMRIEVRRTSKTPPWATDPRAMPDGWNVKLILKNKSMSLDFWKGQGHHGNPPQLEEVLECLVSDASLLDSVADFWGYCEDFGITPSKEAEASYKATIKQSAKFKEFLGEELYQDLLSSIYED